MKTCVVLIDGEHYPPVVKASLDKIEDNHAILALVFLGGTEKISSDIPDSMHGYPLVHNPTMEESLKNAIIKFQPDVVIDLSDEPVLGYIERFNLANIALSNGVKYIGADFIFCFPEKADISKKPSISIIGTGKRVGKTAVSAYACRVLKKAGLNPAVVAMGRGGPPEPDILRGAEIKLDANYLLELADQGKHAASDYFEDALMSRITTVGCRRCGGGVAGQAYISNVLEGAKVANTLDEELIIYEGSGSSTPPVKTDKTIITISANQPIEYIRNYFGPYRIMQSDLAIVTNCEEPSASKEKVISIHESIKNINNEINIIETIFRPKPLDNIKDKKVFFATTAPKIIGDKLIDHLEKEYECSIIGVSYDLSNRKLLKNEISKLQGNFDVLLTELKAAAVDVVARIGVENGLETVFCDNIPYSINKDINLQDEIIDLAKSAKKNFIETGL